MSEVRACNKCRKVLSDDCFNIKRNGNYNMNCNSCINKVKIHRENNRCEHKKLPGKCIICFEDNYCIHNLFKENCVECNGNQICQHKVLRCNCKKCSNEFYIISLLLNNIKHVDETIEYDDLKFNGRDLREHLESQFDNKTNWNNHNSYWRISFIRNIYEHNISREELINRLMLDNITIKIRKSKISVLSTIEL